MRHIISINAILFFILIIGCKRPDIEPAKSGKEGQSLPAFNLRLADSTHFFNTADFDKNKSVVLFYFSTSCPYCRMQTRRIVNNMDKLKDVQFCLISNGKVSELKAYDSLFGLNRFQNIRLGIDTGYVFAKYFHPPTVPFTTIYGKDKKLKQVYLGALTSDQLIRKSKA